MLTNVIFRASTINISKQTRELEQNRMLNMWQLAENHFLQKEYWHEEEKSTLKLAQKLEIPQQER